jgi:hypothetical protein
MLQFRYAYILTMVRHLNIFRWHLISASQEFAKKFVEETGIDE